MLWPVSWACALPLILLKGAGISGSMSDSSIQNPCCDQLHGPCLRDLHVLSLGQEKSQCLQMNLSSSSFGQFKEVECWSLLTGGWRGGRLRSASVPDGWSLVLVSWRAEDFLVPDDPMSSLYGTDHRRSCQKGFLRRKTYFPVLDLRRSLVETPVAAKPPDGMV